MIRNPDKASSSEFVKIDKINNTYSVDFYWNKKSNITFATADMYIDKDETIYAVPCGWDRITQKSVNVSGVDLLFILKQPYSDDDIELFLFNTLNNCYIKEREQGLGPLEKHFGFKTWSRAVKGLKLVSFTWVKNKGCYFVPSVKTPNKGYNLPDKEKWIWIGENPKKGELAKAFCEALAESTL